MECSGITNLMGIRQPELRGIYLFKRDRKQYSTALRVMDLGAFVFPMTSGPVSVKSNTAYFLLRSIVKFKLSGVPSSIYYTLEIVWHSGKL